MEEIEMVMRGTLEMTFEYDEENFDGELTAERVKDSIQDTVLANPGMIHSNVSIVEDPSPEEGLSSEALTKLEDMEPTEEELSALDTGDIFTLNAGSNIYYVLVDVKFLGDNRDNIWSYANAATGEFQGLLRDGACPDHYPEMIQYYGHQNELTVE